MVTYLYPPGTIARGHVERLNQNSYLSVLQINTGDKHDGFELHAIDPSHAKIRAETFCKTLGIHLELEISQHVKAAFLDDMTGDSQTHTTERVKPAFFRQSRRNVA